MTGIAERKADHIELCATGDVGFRQKTTLFDDVELVHDALPEVDLSSIDASTTVFGKRLRAPLFIASMTGGTGRAEGINRELSRIAEERGYGFGLGSQRSMLVDEERAATFEVRDGAPTALVLGNLGGVQVRSMTTEAVLELVRRVGADALCVHLNPAQEIVQPGGDRDFRGVVDAIARLVRDLPVPVVAKETGCGIGPRAASKLARVGVRHLDVSGSGGTSWVAVEAARASGAELAIGNTFREWGVPTAASILCASRARPRFKTIIATGGVSSGLDVAKAIALGASAAGIARPVLQAFVEGGRAGALAFLDGIEAELRAAMLLVGASCLEGLREADVLVGPRLAQWEALAAKTGRKRRR